MNIRYPSDVSREQFALILPILESSRHKTRPRTIDLHDIFCGICYVLKSGCKTASEGRQLAQPHVAKRIPLMAALLFLLQPMEAQKNR